eukprot:scaffold89396_cov66-Phaeocystis_antarctica.AAC.2
MAELMAEAEPDGRSKLVLPLVAASTRCRVSVLSLRCLSAHSRMDCGAASSGSGPFQLFRGEASPRPKRPKEPRRSRCSRCSSSSRRSSASSLMSSRTSYRSCALRSSSSGWHTLWSQPKSCMPQHSMTPTTAAHSASDAPLEGSPLLVHELLHGSPTTKRSAAPRAPAASPTAKWRLALVR